MAAVVSALVVNLDGFFQGVAGSFGVLVDVVDAKQRETHAWESNTFFSNTHVRR